MVFREDGHLSGEALEALAKNEDRFSELERLEIAEHLAFCDYCLQRYTMALEDGALLVPEHSCQKALWVRIQSRALRLLTSRYATAAAAVALALTVLWGSAGVSLPQREPILPEIPQRLQHWPARWNDSLDGALSRFNGMFDDLGGASRPAQGGNT